jgi:hypothetical protein
MSDIDFYETYDDSITDQHPCQRHVCDASSLLAIADDGA